MTAKHSAESAENAPGADAVPESAAPDPVAPEVDLGIVGGDPTPTELAAITAVIAAMAEESADSAGAGSPRVSAWQRSQRGVRRTLTPGNGAWRGFSG